MKKSSIKIWFYITVLFMMQFIILNNITLAQMPLHERVRSMIKNGIINAPYFFQHPEELRQKGVDMPWRQILERQHGIHLERKNISEISKTGKQKTIATVTSYNALLILVKFSDKNSSVNATSFDQLAFGTTGNTLRTYYNAVSRATLDIITVNLPSSLGWKQMTQTYNYYVNGQNGLGTYPQNAQKLAEDAVDSVDADVDFSQYDNDGDGYVDALMIVHSGPGAEYTGSVNDIWSHSWAMSSPKLHDGVYTYAYTMEPEYWQSAGDMTCGVYAHEFGHMVFDLPDLYDTDYSSEGLGNWSLMAGGSWNGPNNLGDSPAFPDAWCRIEMGYASVTNITSNITGQQIQNVQSSSSIYRLWKNGETGSQYFLVENRQQSGFDTYLPGNGLIIYHLDDNVYGNNNEWYPGHTTSGHYQVAIEQADNSFNLERNQNRGDGGDIYPGSSNNRSFTSSSSPNSNDYNGNSTYVSVLNISNSSSTMTADFRVGNIIVDQKLADNATRVGTIGRWNGSSFPTPRLTPGQPIAVTEGTTETLQGDQAIYNGEKYNIWTRNLNAESDVLNHHSFIIQPNDFNFTSSFRPTNSATVQAQLLEGGSPDGYVDFMDPWLVDYPDPSYGNNLRNQGMSAPFKSVAYSVNNLSTSTVYKGVFFDQGLPNWDPPYYSVRAPLTQTINGHTGYFQNWSTSGANVQSSTSLETPVVFTYANATVTANYKGTNLTGDGSTYSYNNQRRIVKAYNGSLHKVYESMGKVWYETSTDDGSTWGVMNNGKPISANDAKLPAVAYRQGLSEILIVYQEDTKLVLHFYDNNSYQTPLYTYDISLPAGVSYSENLNPSIAWRSNGQVMVVYDIPSVWGVTPGIYYWYGFANGHGILPEANGIVPNTGSSSNHPSVVQENYTSEVFHLVWEESSSIKYYKMTGDQANDVVNFSDYYTVSASLGYGTNIRPTIAEDNNANYPTRFYVSWITEHPVTYIQEGAMRINTNGSWNYLTYTYSLGGGNNVETINSNENSSLGAIIAVGSSQTNGKYVKTSNPTSTYTIPYSGDVKMSNGTSYADQRISILQKQSTPYSFVLHGQGGLQKSNDKIIIANQINLKNEGQNIYFGFGEIEVDGEFVRFEDEEDLDVISSAEAVRKHFLSKPFALTDNSEFNFVVHQYTGDNQSKTFSDDNSLELKIRLIDDQTNDVIGEFTNDKYDSKKEFKNNTAKYKVDTKGIGNRIVRLELTVEGIFDSNYHLITKVNASGEELPKENEIDVEYEGSLAIKDFDLMNNYPNPFNPSTTITYQLPVDGFITLKIYDVLGKEITTLVEDVKSKGRYNVVFDALKLSSGIYIYTLDVNGTNGKNFRSSKKMLMIK